MRALTTAASGMAAQQASLDTIANNLANIQTTGYKRSRTTFQDLMYQELTHGGHSASSARIDVGSGVRIAGIDKTFQQGSADQTGNELDVMIEGPNGFFELQDQQGNFYYTRDGSFRLDANGQIVSASGLSVGGISLDPNAERLEITPDGTVNMFYADDVRPVDVGQIPVRDFINPGGLRAIGGNLFQQTEASGQAQDMGGIGGVGPVLRQGFLEGSNVDVANELVTMIMTQRAYEMNSKAVQAADETMRAVTNLRG